jgi:predicted nucleic acid-binding protein
VPGQLLVLDTNIVLDLFVFADEAARPVRSGLEGGDLRWLATRAMRDELERVLAYAQIVPRLAFYGLAAADVLTSFDRHSERRRPRRHALEQGPGGAGAEEAAGGVVGVRRSHAALTPSSQT